MEVQLHLRKGILVRAEHLTDVLHIRAQIIILHLEIIVLLGVAVVILHKEAITILENGNPVILRRDVGVTDQEDTEENRSHDVMTTTQAAGRVNFFGAG